MKIRLLAALLVLALFCVVLGNHAPARADAEKKDMRAEIEALKTAVARLQMQVQNSQDFIAISNLQAAYGYYVDKCEWDQTADLFAKDGCSRSACAACGLARTASARTCTLCLS